MLGSGWPTGHPLFFVTSVMIYVDVGVVYRYHVQVPCTRIVTDGMIKVYKMGFDDGHCWLPKP